MALPAWPESRLQVGRAGSGWGPAQRMGRQAGVPSPQGSGCL